MSDKTSTDNVRLGHALAMAGVASRRASEQLVFQGRVKVNGQVVLEPQHKVNFDHDVILVDGQKIKGIQRKVYFILNKPEGMLCTTEPGLAKIVTDLFAHLPYRLFSVGRLDQATKGLLLVTNDGDFAHKVMHPSFNITKEYLAKVGAEVSAEHLEAISRGVVIEGVHVKPQQVTKVRRGTLKITVGEGKKHEVRLLLAHAKLEVRELIRIRIGSLHLGNLAEGAYRELSPSEIEGLLKESSNGSKTVFIPEKKPKGPPRIISRRNRRAARKKSPLFQKDFYPGKRVKKSNEKNNSGRSKGPRRSSHSQKSFYLSKQTKS